MAHLTNKNITNNKTVVFNALTDGQSRPLFAGGTFDDWSWYCRGGLHGACTQVRVSRAGRLLHPEPAMIHLSLPAGDHHWSVWGQFHCTRQGEDGTILLKTSSNQHPNTLWRTYFYCNNLNTMLDPIGIYFLLLLHHPTPSHPSRFSTRRPQI